MMRVRSRPVPVKARPSSSTSVLERLGVDRGHQPVDVDEQLGGGERDLGVRGGDDAALAQVGGCVRARPQVDELLADRGLVRHHGDDVARDSRSVVLDVEGGVDAVVGERQLADLADGDAAIGDLSAGEDAAGVLELCGDRVAAVDEEPVDLRVPSPDDGSTDQSDDREDDELDLDASGDHRATAGPTRIRPKSDSCALARLAAGVRHMPVILQTTCGACSSPDGASLDSSSSDDEPEVPPPRRPPTRSGSCSSGLGAASWRPASAAAASAGRPRSGQDPQAGISTRRGRGCPAISPIVCWTRQAEVDVEVGVVAVARTLLHVLPDLGGRGGFIASASRGRLLGGAAHHGPVDAVAHDGVGEREREHDAERLGEAVAGVRELLAGSARGRRGP